LRQQGFIVRLDRRKNTCNTPHGL